MKPRLLRRALPLLLSLLLILAVFYHSQLAPAAPPLIVDEDAETPIRGLSDEFKWKTRRQVHPVGDMIKLPSGRPAPIPKIQYDFPTKIDPHRRKLRQQRLKAVKDSFVHSWTGYRTHAWMHDEVCPVSGDAKNGFGSWGATLVDSLDTLWIMGLKAEFEEAVGAVGRIDFSRTDLGTLNVFETTIRYLGGLLGAYDLSDGAYPVLLEKATELGDMLYAAFDTPNRMPITRWDWKE